MRQHHNGGGRRESVEKVRSFLANVQRQETARQARKTATPKATVYLSCDIFDGTGKALGFIEVDQHGIDVYPKNAKKPFNRLTGTMCCSGCSANDNQGRPSLNAERHS